LIYNPFNYDFGPLSLAHVHKYIRELVRLLVDSQFKNYRIFHYCSDAEDKRSNSAFLIGCFMVVVLKMDAT
jgi:cell division cycle 14